ncbi:MAG: hypothetical protein QNJ62_05180 [Methyloceanibacter sp.]|nr:hypothetical protein [Methyloceanibacter sp.]
MTLGFMLPTPQSVQRSRSVAARVPTVPSPNDGLNLRDGLARLAPTEATRLDNFFPCFDCVRVRLGYGEFVGTGLGSGSVPTLAEYRSGSSHAFLAGANGNLYNIASGSAVSLASGYAENRWQWQNFDGKLGLVNGTDTPQQYNGTAVSNLTLTASSGSFPAGQPIGIAGHRSRTYFWWDNDQSLWYSALNALGGSLTEFNLSRVGQFGGKVVAVSTATVGGEAGDFAGGGIAEDLLVIHMSSGDVIVYQGSDPGSDFVMVGVYRTGTPVDPRTTTKIGDDVVLLNSDGAVPLSQVLRVGRFSRNRTLSEKIRPDIIDAVANNGANSGWELIYWPSGPWVLVNVPISSTQSYQYVMNAETTGWCTYGRFSSPINAATWGLFDDGLYWGSHDGKVYRMQGFTDVGASIVTSARQAPNAFGPQAIQKLVKGIRPLFEGEGDYSMGVSVESDFKQRTPPSSEITYTGSGVAWEDVEDDWDMWDYEWGSDLGGSVFGDWIARDARGNRFNVHLTTSSASELKWFSTDFRIQNGVGI